MPELNDYGPMVIGEEAYAKLKLIREKAADVYGPLVVGDVAKGPAAAPPPPPAPEPGILDGTIASVRAALGEITSTAALEKLLAAERAGKTRKGILAAIDARISELKPADVAPATSIKDLEAALDENPAATEELLSAELARVEGPRLVALRKLREVEGLRPVELGGPREHVLAAIDAALVK